MKALENQALEALAGVLNEVPPIELGEVLRQPTIQSMYGPDFYLKLDVAGRAVTLACEVKKSGEPRFAREALLQLRSYIAHGDPDAVPVFIAPYLSQAVKALCREHDVSFLDLEGNCRLSFNGIYIERSVPSKSTGEQRAQKSIFWPKSAQILRVLLRDPAKPWRVQELADASDVSIGQVSKIRNALLDKEWASAGGQGICLDKPNELLDAWREVYEPPRGERFAFYTTLHGSAVDKALSNTPDESEKRKGKIVRASFSAAQWLSPYARVSSYYFYVDKPGLEALKSSLRMESAARGENVFVTIPNDDGLFLDSVEPAPSIICTSPVQTYLDLTVAGERGSEAAEHLRSEQLKWK